MSQSTRHKSGGNAFVRNLPVVGTLYREWRLWREECAKPHFRVAPLDHSSVDFPAYPIDMSPLLNLPFGHLDEAGVPYNEPDGQRPGAYQPTSIAQYGLAHWNAFLDTGDRRHAQAFMAQAQWLVTHEIRLANGAGVWPLPFVAHGFDVNKPWLSALTQGNAVSVLVRAYRLTREPVYLECARRAVRSFELDILDGGVSAPVGLDGIFFEEVASYPASRILNGYVLALFGLFDYVELTGDSSIRDLAERSVVTFHCLLDGYEMGFWSSYDLYYKRPASRFYHALHVVLLRALSRYTGCEHCAALASKWDAYQQRRVNRVRYYFVSRGRRYRTAARQRIGRLLLRIPGRRRHEGPTRVCVPITAFPVAGGMRAVLAGVAAAMAGEWQMEYLTRRIGPDAQGLTIESFEHSFRPLGHETTSPLQYPNVWLYVRAGRRKLLRLLREGKQYDLMLPQDGLYSTLFAGAMAKIAGIHVVVMDHGTATLPYSAVYRTHRLQAIRTQPWPKRAMTRVRFARYLPVLRGIARQAVRSADMFLVAGDEVQEAYQQHLGVHLSRIVRYPYMVDTERYSPGSAAARGMLRERYGVPRDAIVISMVNRLVPEKGMDVALEGLMQALSRQPESIRSRVRLLVAGDGPWREEVEANVQRLRLDGTCMLLGEATASDVTTLLNGTDIFLYCGTRGTNFSMGVLEAMAAGCAVIASTEPKSNARLLDEGRGIAIPPRDAQAVGAALSYALSQPEQCRRMGQAARDYVAMHHSASALRRSLLRATYWAPDIVEDKRAVAPAGALRTTHGV